MDAVLKRSSGYLTSRKSGNPSYPQKEEKRIQQAEEHSYSTARSECPSSPRGRRCVQSAAAASLDTLEERNSSTDTATEGNSSTDTAAEENSSTDTAEENELTTIPEPLTSLFDASSCSLEEADLSELCKIKYMMYKSQHNEQHFINLERMTRQQADNPIWQGHRAGRATASNAHEIARMKDSPSLVKKVMQYTSFTSKSTHYGSKYESEAIQYFKQLESSKHKGFCVSPSGLIVDCNEPCLGASPDGFVTCSCHGKSVLEVKCPLKYEQGFNGWQQDPEFPIDSNGNVKTKHKYFSQIQLQMSISGTDYCYFFMYSPKPDFLSTVILRDDNFILELKKKIVGNFKAHILPEIVSRKMDSEKYPMKRTVICSCRRPAFGLTVTCSHCNIEFHYPCVQIIRAPKREWFCLECRFENL